MLDLFCSWAPCRLLAHRDISYPFPRQIAKFRFLRWASTVCLDWKFVCVPRYAEIPVFQLFLMRCSFSPLNSIATFRFSVFKVSSKFLCLATSCSSLSPHNIWLFERFQEIGVATVGSDHILTKVWNLLRREDSKFLLSLRLQMTIPQSTDQNDSSTSSHRKWCQTDSYNQQRFCGPSQHSTSILRSGGISHQMNLKQKLNQYMRVSTCQCGCSCSIKLLVSIFCWNSALISKWTKGEYGNNRFFLQCTEAIFEPRKDGCAPMNDRSEA